MEEFRRRKRYNLSLKKKNPNEIPQTFTKIETKEKNDVSIVEKEWNQTTDTMDSQNFHLRISDSFNLDDSEELTKPKKIPAPTRNQRESIIVISDSSDEEILLPRQPPENNRFQSCIKTNNNNKAHLSSGTNSPLIEDDDSELWKHNTDKNREYSSDETNFELNCDDDKYSVIESSVTNKIDKIRSNEEPVRCQIPREKLDSLRNVRNNGTTEPAKLSTLTTLHSKDIAKNIMKIITSKKIESPVIQKDHIIDETASEIVSDRESDRLPQPVWIEETASEASPSPPKATKTQVTRVLNPPIQTTNNDQLSEQKKRQISLWLMNNSPNDDRSDDSISYIPPSHRRTSESSGNSSLDRLEANYETPNNRNKFRDKLNFKQLANNVMNSPNLNKTVTPRQTVMDDYLKKTKSSVRSKKTYTPLPVVKTKPAVVSPTIETPKTTIEDCADILDELYGDAWRHKADVILPRTEPRRNVKMTDRGVQTERIKVPKKMVGRLVEDEKSFDNFVKNVKPNTNSTKKNHKGYRRDSFIVDSSDSDTSTGETTYMTALTNPRISDLQREERKKPPMSENTRKAILICDSESEDDTTPVRSNVDHRRRLLFSDDEEDKSTETSEYDPDDVVPPKTVLPKPVRSVMGNKILAKPAKSSTVKRIEKHKSFLASLSATVPMAATHPDAKKFKQNFKNTKDELVKYLFKLYNEKIFDNQLPHDMLIEWNVRMTGTAGFCYNKRTMGLADFVRTSRIVLATKILDTADRLRDTLVHEMCHAAAWIINQVSDGHGPFWRGWASKAMKVFPELPPIKRCHDYKINTKYTYRCMQCGYSIGRHSKSLDTEKKRCGHCFGRFELLVNRVTKSGTKLQIPKTPNDRQPTAFALFVKDNYSTVKKTRQGLAHKEVMQLLGQQFSAIKLSKKTREERRPSVEISD